MDAQFSVIQIHNEKSVSNNTHSHELPLLSNFGDTGNGHDGEGHDCIEKLECQLPIEEKTVSRLYFLDWERLLEENG